MKTGKIILIALLVVVVIACAYFFGMKSGADLVRNGIVANYPTIKNVVHGAMFESDSTVSVSLTKANDEALFNLLKGDAKSDTVQFSVPYYGRYGVDLSVRNFRVFKTDEGVEVWLPAATLRYCELKFDRMILNGKPAVIFKNDNTAAVKNKIYEYLIPVLEKNKANQKATKVTVAKAMMFYFMPYKFGLKLYIGEEEQTLPLVPGVNQSVDDAIKEAIGKPLNLLPAKNGMKQKGT